MTMTGRGWRFDGVLHGAGLVPGRQWLAVDPATHTAYAWGFHVYTSRSYAWQATRLELVAFAPPTT